MQETESKLTRTELDRILKEQQEKWQLMLVAHNASVELKNRVKELELAIKILDKMELPVEAQVVLDAVKKA